MNDDLEDARRKGEEMGHLKSTQGDHTRRIGRLEKGVLGLMGAIAAAWAKSRGLF